MYEETGFDISKLAVEEEFIEGVLNYQYTRLYLIRNVPIETIFVPRTRKEIKYCKWFCVDHLPVHKTDQVSKAHLGINANSFFMIMPFVKRLKKWIAEKQNGGKYSATSTTDNSNVTSAKKASRTTKNFPPAIHNPSGSNSPRTVFFKNNSSHRQRHKSLGDIENQIVINSNVNGSGDANSDPTNISMPKTNMVKILQYPARQQQQQQKQQPSQLNVTTTHVQDASNNQKHKFVATAIVDKVQKPLKSSDTQSDRPQPKQIDVGLNIAGGKKVQRKLYKTEYGMQQMSISPNWIAVSTPQFAQMLQNEPNIKNWLNIQLNKDIIFKESLKLLL